MGIRRAELPFEGHFTQIPNAWLRDERLSRRARGLLGELMSHRVGWRITLANLVRTGPEGRDAINTAIGELVSAGYLVREQERADHGRFGEVEYRIAAPSAAHWESTDDGFSGSGEIRVIPVGEPMHRDGKSTDDGLAVNGSPVDGESAPKKNISKEHDLEEHNGGGAAGATVFELDVPKGTRSALAIPSQFVLQPGDREWASEHVPSVNVDVVTRDFVAYWREGEGKGRRKKNWPLTWRTWLRREHARNVERGWKPAVVGDERKVIRGGRVVG